MLEATKPAVLAEKHLREKAGLNPTPFLLKKSGQHFFNTFVYVNNVLLGKLLESPTLAQQAANNTKEQFANSPDLQDEIMNAIIAALDAHTLMSKQALDSETVRSGIKDILLNHAQLWEALRSKVGAGRPGEAKP